MASIMMKCLTFAFVVCSFAFTNVLPESTTTKSSSEANPSDVVGTSVPPQNAAPQTSTPSQNSDPQTSTLDSQKATGKQDQVTTVEAGTQSVSQMKENISPGGTQADNKATSTTGPQNKSPQTTQSPGSQSSTVQVEGQPTKTDDNATTVTNDPNSSTVPVNATAGESHNESATDQQRITDENHQNTTQSPDATAAINSTAKQPQTTVVSTAIPVPKPGRSFDLVSFIGGLLIAVCFILIAVFLYCCSKTEKRKPYENLE